MANTLASWRSEILAHHATGASNGLTEGLNLCGLITGSIDREHEAERWP